MRNKFKFIDNDNNKLSLIIIDDNEHTAELERMDFSIEFNGELIMPSSVTYKGTIYTITDIDRYAFLNCEDLTSIIIPDSVTNITSYAFAGCCNLISINVDDNNEKYSSIDGILYNKTKTALILWPNAKKGDVVIPDSIISIDEEAFEWCYGLTSFNVTTKNKEYSSIDGILYDKAKTTLILCPNAKTGDIIIPNSVINISDSAFAYCNKITSITIPNSVTNIGDFAFEHCRSLTSITNMSINPQEIDSTTFNKVSEDVVLYVPESSILKYINSQWWKQFKIIKVIK